LVAAGEQTGNGHLKGVGGARKGESKMQRLTDETLELLRSANAGLAKAWTQASGLVAYDLEAPSKKLYPVLTPLRNVLPRLKSNRGDTAIRWKAVTGINVGNISPGVSEGNRAAVTTSTTANYTAPYAGLGLEDYVTFEAEYAGQSFEDVRAVAVEALLQSLMLGEEFCLLNGNASLQLGSPVAPVNGAIATGGTLANGNYKTWVVALTPEGYRNSSVAGGVPTVVLKKNADGSTDTYGGGSSNISPASNQVTSGATEHKYTATVTAIKGAAGYAWFIGATAATAALAAITTVPTATFDSPALGTQLASSITDDNSTNGLIFDGFITQALKSGTAYYSDKAGGYFSGDSTTGITEVDTMLKYMWDTFRLGPDEIIVSSQELMNMTRLVVGGGGTPLFRFNLDANAATPQALTVSGGMLIGNYFNKYNLAGGQIIPIRLHPNMTPGTLLALTNKLPYPLSNVTNVSQIVCRQDYYQIEWPLRARRYEYGVYADEVLQVYAPFAFGVISGIGNGVTT
jgi:hypothetical protein